MVNDDYRFKNLNDPESPSRLIEMLEVDDSKIRSSVCFALNRLAKKFIFEPSCLEKIIPLLNDEDSYTRTFAAELIGTLAFHCELVDTKCLPHLVGLLHDENGRVRLAASDTLNKLSFLGKGAYNGTCLNKALVLLNDEDDQIRSNAAELVAHLSDRGVADAKCVPRLIELMDDKNKRVRECVCYNLIGFANRGIYDASYLDKAIVLLKDEDWVVRAFAARLIGHLADKSVYDPKCLPLIVELLNDEETRSFAIYSLRKIAINGFLNISCLEKVAALLYDGSFDVRKDAIVIIEELIRREYSNQ